MKVLITREIADVALKALSDAGLTYVQYTGKVNLTQPELIEMCRDFDAFISVGRNKLDAHFLNTCKHLKAISLLSAGYDNVDVDVANKLKRPIGHTPGVVSGATADVAFLLMLSVSRNAFYLHNSIAKGNWGFFEPTANLGIELNGKTLGIFGLGKIGFELAKKCSAAYNMNIIYHNRTRNNEAEQAFGAKAVSFDELLSESDVLSIHAGLSSETEGLFNKEAFTKMKPSSIFINTARGAIHNEQDLYEALKHKTIWGAGIDVTNPEPMLPDNPLLSMPHVCVLPHIGTATVETRNAMALIAAQNIIECLKGNPMPHVINPEVYK